MHIHLARYSTSALILVTLLVFGQPVSARGDEKTQGMIREEDRLGARSDEYSRVFEKAISSLVKADAGTFRSLLSSTTLLNETRGPGAIDAVIQTRFIPFFSDFAELTDSITTVPTYDAAGSTGLALARSFTTTGGERKSFVIYLVNEKKRVVVGNLVPNATAVDLKVGKSKDFTKK